MINKTRRTKLVSFWRMSTYQGKAHMSFQEYRLDLSNDEWHHL